MKSNFTVSDMLDAAEALIKMNGQTTTLEIKEKLQKDFKAFQSDVSDMMMDNYSTVDLDFSANGTYRTYTKIANQSGISGGLGNININMGSIPIGKKPVFITSKHAPVVPFPIAYKRKDGRTIQSYASQPVGTCWKVFSAGFPKDAAYFPWAHTREMVRQAFASATNTKYIDTRTKTVK